MPRGQDDWSQIVYPHAGENFEVQEDGSADLESTWEDFGYEARIREESPEGRKAQKRTDASTASRLHLRIKPSRLLKQRGGNAR
jgi:hypothetical protein